MVDMDGFKRINDQHGHAVGAQALQEIVRGLKENFRSVDILAW